MIDKKILILLMLLIASVSHPVRAQEVVDSYAGDSITMPAVTVGEVKPPANEVSFFIPHYYLTAMGGVNHCWQDNIG